MKNQKPFQVAWFLVVNEHILNKDCNCSINSAYFPCFHLRPYRTIFPELLERWDPHDRRKHFFLMFDRAQNQIGKSKAQALAKIALADLKHHGTVPDDARWALEAKAMFGNFTENRKKTKDICVINNLNAPIKWNDFLKEREDALDNWLSFCITAEEIKEVFNFIPFENEIEIEALKKWLALCSTFSEVESVHEAFKKKIKKNDIKSLSLHNEHLLDNGSTQSIFNRWTLVCASIEESRNVFEIAPQFSKEQRFAMEKWLSFCETVEEAKVALNAASTDCTRSLAIRRINELI